MRIAVCVRELQEQEVLFKWIKQYCDAYDIPCDLFAIAELEDLFRPERSFHIAFLGFGGRDGFSLVRRLREADKRCRIVIIDDTAEYAVQGVRLASDYIVRPVDFKKVVRAMKLATA